MNEATRILEESIRLVQAVVHKAKDFEDAKKKIDYLLKLIQERRFTELKEQFELELGIFKPLF